MTPKELEYFSVKFNSYGTFDQMKLKPSDEHNEVELFCQEDDGRNEGIKEIIFNLPTPENYKDEMAQFSITEKEARLLINTFRFHFGIND